MLLLLPKGTCLRFEYRDAEDGAWKPRTGFIWGRRNLEKDPLSSKAIAERPDLERDTVLLTIYDLARGEYRSFYPSRMRAVQVTDHLPVLIVAASMLRKRAS